ncbi:MAG: hypothetical protein JW967_01270 [Dehalococcoidales bacterium]|nr:hypothetical protein [Dehalococcoidales bacterium]
MSIIDKSIADKEEVKTVFTYSLLEAIARRRTRRFPIGCTFDEGALKYISSQKPIPLNDVELAILCWSGAGITGSAIQDVGAAGDGQIASWIGRVIPNPCNVNTTRLFFTNDSGTYLYNPTKASKQVEIMNETDRNKIMAYFEQDCYKIMDGRLQMYPSVVPPPLIWNTNQPGTTVFIPVVDNVELYLYRVFTSLSPQPGYQLFDAKKKRSAGLQKWVDSGDLKGPRIDISSFEQNMQQGIFSAPAYLMLEHMHLVAEAMGLGAIMFASYVGEVMLGITPLGKGLGFHALKDKDGNLNPIGLDGVFEAFCPPYYKNMDEAVDAYIEKLCGLASTKGPDYKGIIPFKKKYWQKIKPTYVKPSKKHIEIMKAYCNYIYDTYGRIPVTSNAKVIPCWLQVHHLEVDFYKKYYAKGLITEAHENHMKLWHRDQG